MRDIPRKYNHVESENKWVAKWEELGINEWDEGRSEEEAFIVDTPPPTVSGSLHIGHVFSYTQTDLVVRYQRMLQKNIMYPMGWDDNGLPTERRVQNKFNIRCNPHLPYNEKWKPVESSKDSKLKDSVEVSRENFIEACEKVTFEDEAAFEDLWKRLGLSVDWKQSYSTINSHCRKVSQLSFLDLFEKGLVYSSESPTMWDVEFQTALAQADLEDREIRGAYHDLLFSVEGSSEEFIISTTRPELLVSCIAVVAHPEDERYKKYFGSYAVTPLFSAKVPILPAEHADPEKGTGILMVCTFGDIHDVEWWKTSSLPLKQAIGRDGRFLSVDFDSLPFMSLDPEKAKKAYKEIEGLSIIKARESIVNLLLKKGSAFSGSSSMKSKPRPIEHPVKFYEKGSSPIEFVTTRQWFIKLLDHKKELLAQGEKINWHPDYMKSRYSHWVEGLNHDWCISRQRFFGVPFPVWYQVKENGEVDYKNPILASKETLPVDPLSEVPPGYDESQRGVPGGFIGDPDVMDTWATSSMTPQIVSHWGENDERHFKLFPMDIRPQSHEIIRTWAFYTILKAWMHFDEIPWKNILISGWILDPDRKKMSKSKGNVVTPHNLLAQYSSDAVRYWASRARLGVDTAFDEKVFKSGQKLSTKIFNASRFVLMQIASYLDSHSEMPDVSAISEELDRAFISRIKNMIEKGSESFETFDYATVLQIVESNFWFFCDNYLELVKGRIYSSDNEESRASAIATLSYSLSVFLRMFSPFMPYITEEVWSWFFAENQGQPSIHKSSWPTIKEIQTVKAPNDFGVLNTVIEVVEAIRSEKSSQQKTLKWPVQTLEIIGKEDILEPLNLVLEDIRRVGRVVEEGVILYVGEVSGEGVVDTKVTLANSME